MEITRFLTVALPVFDVKSSGPMVARIVGGVLCMHDIIYYCDYVDVTLSKHRWISSAASSNSYTWDDWEKEGRKRTDQVQHGAVSVSVSVSVCLMPSPNH